ncbi:MAG: DUF1015 domain-containing protein [Acidimicrobiales bacterium]|nr:DUF1015 domain-containing protein [Acidimicrobiales bacterium]
MPRFEPFSGIRYDTERVSLADVTAPPYDVISADERARLAARSPVNVVRIDLPEDDGTGDRYQAAARTLERWRREGVLVADEEPSFYVHRMGYHDSRGRARQTAGVIGALELVRPGAGGVLPHERTTPKARTDRLQLLRACRANLSAVWGLSLAPGLVSLCELPGAPVGRFTDDAGVHHRLYRISEPAVVEALADTVSSAPVIIADGHHRFETSLAYRDERRDGAGGNPGPYDLVMTYVVELTESQLDVLPIHRLVDGLPRAIDVLEALAPFFDAGSSTPLDDAALATITDRMAEAGALALVLPEGLWLLHPRAEAFGGVDDLDSARLDLALAALPPHGLAYQHGVDNVVREVRAGHADAGVLLRPASVSQIAATAHDHRLMPPKSTFFAPKPCTGLVLRDLS